MLQIKVYQVKLDVSSQSKPWWAFWRKPILAEVEAIVDEISGVEAERAAQNSIFGNELIHQAYCHICIENTQS